MLLSLNLQPRRVSSRAHDVPLPGGAVPATPGRLLRSARHAVRDRVVGGAGIVVLLACMWFTCCWRNRKEQRSQVSSEKSPCPSREQALGFVLHSNSVHSNPSVPGSLPASTPRASSGPSGAFLVPMRAISPGSPHTIQPPRSMPHILMRGSEGSAGGLPGRLYAHSDNGDSLAAAQQWRAGPRSPLLLPREAAAPPLRRSYSADAELAAPASRSARDAGSGMARSFSAATEDGQPLPPPPPQPQPSAPPPPSPPPPPPLRTPRRDRGDAATAAQPSGAHTYAREGRASITPPLSDAQEQDVVAAARINAEVRKLGRTLRENGAYTHFTIHSMLGRGAFGTVYRGVPRPQPPHPPNATCMLQTVTADPPPQRRASRAHGICMLRPAHHDCEPCSSWSEFETARV